MLEKRFNFWAISIAFVLILFTISPPMLSGKDSKDFIWGFGSKFGLARLDLTIKEPGEIVTRIKENSSLVGLDFFVGIRVDEIQYKDAALKTHIGLSIGFTHFPGLFDQGLTYSSDIQNKRLQTFVYQVEIFLKQELGKNLAISFVGGLDRYKSITGNTEYPNKAETKYTGKGWHVALRPEIIFLPFKNKEKKLSLYLEIGYYSGHINFSHIPGSNGTSSRIGRLLGQNNNRIVGQPPPKDRPPKDPGCAKTAYSTGIKVSF